MLRVLAVLMIASATAGAQPVDAPAPATRVAIVPGVAVNIGPTRVDALTQDLADALNAELVVDAAGGLEVRRELPADLADGCVTQPACIQQVAKATGAAQLLFVVMIDAGGDAISVDTTWVDAASGKSIGRPPVSLTNTSDVDAKGEVPARREVAVARSAAQAEADAKHRRSASTARSSPVRLATSRFPR